MATQKFYPGYWAAQRPDQPAFIMGETGETVSYRELDARSNQVAQLLRDRGVRPGDTIAILLENDRAYLEICWGAQRAGVVYTPINWHLTPGEIEYIVNDCGAKVLFASSRTSRAGAWPARQDPQG